MARLYLIAGTEPVHIDPPVLLKLPEKFAGKGLMKSVGKIPECIFYSQLFLNNGKNILPFRSMADIGIKRAELR
jgi:hypothetical protein